MGRRIWNWHFWLGLAVLLPLLYWMGTALVFALWPIETVRGKAGSTGLTPPPLRLKGGMMAPPDRVEGSRSVTIRGVEGHPVALIDHGARTEVWDLETQQSLGPVIPLAWAREAARRDFAGAFDEAEVLLFPRMGPGTRLSGGGNAPAPEDYTGPRPVYAFHLRPGATRLYVDGLTGEIRARRTRIWRFYDLAFRLHSFEFTGDGLKRLVTGGVVGLWLALGGTGLVLALRRLRSRSVAGDR